MLQAYVTSRSICLAYIIFPIRGTKKLLKNIILQFSQLNEFRLEQMKIFSGPDRSCKKDNIEFVLFEALKGCVAAIGTLPE